MAADYQIGARAFEARDYATATAVWKELADAGHMVAQKSLAVIYAKGLGTPVDDTKAAYWYGKAAAQGHAVAQLRLAIAYTFGAGVPRDLVRAYVWLAHANARFPPGKARTKSNELGDLLVKLMSAAERETALQQLGRLAAAGKLTPISSPPRRLDMADPAGFRDTVNKFVARTKLLGDTLFAGSLQVLGLGQVKAQVGDDWPKMKADILSIVDDVIENNLTDLDLYLRLDEERVILLFGSSLKHEAEAQARTISKEIENLLSALVPKEIEINVSAITAPIDPVAHGAKLFDLSGLIAIVDEAAAKVETQAKAEAAEIVAKTDADTLQFWPVAQLRKKLVSLYLAELVPSTPRAPGTKEAQPGLLDAELDRYLLELVTVRLQEAGGMGDKAIAVVPLHYETLASKTFRQRYLEAVTRLPRSARRRLVLYLADMPDGVPQNRLYQILSPAAKSILGYAIRVPGRFKDFDRLQGSRIPLLVVDAESLGGSGGAEMRLIEALVKAGYPSWRRVMFLGADDPDTAVAVRRAGPAYLAGPALAPASDRFGLAYRIN